MRSSLRRSTAAIAAVASLLAACALVLDFDYDTTELPREAGTATEGDPPIEPGFDIVVPPTLTLSPGTSAAIDVEVRRRGFDGTVTISAKSPLPRGLEPVVAVSAQAGTSTVKLTLTAGLDVDPGPSPLVLVGSSSIGDREATVSLAIRGLSCTLDRSFGETETGIVTLVVDPVANSPLARGIVAGAGTVAVVILDEVGGRFLHVLDERGRVQLAAPADVALQAVAMDEDDRLLVARSQSGTARVQRLLPDAAADPTFGEGGAATAPFYPEILTVFQDGTLGLLGFQIGVPLVTKLTRFDAEGQLVPVGTVEAQSPPGNGVTRGALVGSDRGPLACGYSVAGGGVFRSFVTRWLPDGGADPSFGDGGVAALGAVSNAVSCVATDAGLVVAGGSPRFELRGLLASSAIDTSFGDGGLYRPDTDGGSAATQVLRDAEGRLLVLGSVGPQAEIVRLSAAGIPDETFGPGGRCALGALGVRATAFTLAPDGRILVAGPGMGAATVARLWP